jgi:hypothetical protein
VILAVLLLSACGGAGSKTPTGTPTPQAGSFVAFCASIHVRLLAPPAVMQETDSCRANTLFLVTNIASDTGVEYMTVFRYANDTRGQNAAGWSDVLEGFHALDTKSGDTAWSADSAPSAQAAQSTSGFLGRFTRTDKGGVRYAGVLWTGMAGSDTIAILGQADARQQARLDTDMAQVLRTLDVNAQ